MSSDAGNLDVPKKEAVVLFSENVKILNLIKKEKNLCWGW